jgi:hypothetical protein
MLCLPSCVDAVIAALCAAHPYEEPAWDLCDVKAPADSGESKSRSVRKQG